MSLLTQYPRRMFIAVLVIGLFVALFASLSIAGADNDETKYSLFKSSQETSFTILNRPAFPGDPEGCGPLGGTDPICDVLGEGTITGTHIGQGSFKAVDAADWSEFMEGGPPCFKTVERNVTLTAANGDQIYIKGLVGTRVCVFGAGESDPLVHLVTGGTGRFEGANGVMLLVDAESDSSTGTTTARLVGVIGFDRNSNDD